MLKLETVAVPDGIAECSFASV